MSFKPETLSAEERFTTLIAAGRWLFTHFLYLIKLLESISQQGEG
jgi:hypothetical protein